MVPLGDLDTPCASQVERSIRAAHRLADQDEIVVIADERSTRGLRFAWRPAVWRRGERAPRWLGEPLFARAGEPAQALRERVLQAAAASLYRA